MALNTTDQTVSPTPGAYQGALNDTLANIDRKAVVLYAREHPLWDILKPNFKAERGGSAMELRLVMGRAAGPQVTDSDGSFVAVKNGGLTNTARYTFGDVEVSSVRIDWLDQQKNSGPAQLIDTLKTHREAARYEAMRAVVEHFHTKHDERGERSYLSLDSICNDEVHEIGEIDYTDPGNGDWKPVTRRYSNAQATDIKQAFRAWFQDFTKRSGRKPRKCVVGEDIWNAWLEYLDDVSANNSIGGDAGEVEWESIKFSGVQVAWDPDCAPKRAFGLTPEDLHLRYLNDNFLKVLDAQPVMETRTVGEAEEAQQVIVNTLASVYPIVSVLSAGVRNRRNQGLLIFGDED